MGYITEKLIEDAYSENNLLGGIMDVMNNLGVIGTKEHKQVDQVCDFLRRNKIPHDSADRLVWLESLQPSRLKEIFKKNNAPTKSKESIK